MTPKDTKPRRALGRGLDALLPAPAPRPSGPALLSVPVEALRPQGSQPRRRFDDAALASLARSIREHGVLEPLLVRGVTGKDVQYEIIAGERRWRAAQRAELREVPVIVREATPSKAFELALVENLQREDLNPMEVAQGFRRLIDEHGLTQEAVATSVAKDRSTIANSLRLLKLPVPVQELVAADRLSEGHARALLGAPTDASMAKLAHAAVAAGWSVREVERRARAAAAPRRTSKDDGSSGRSANVRDLELRLSRSLGTKVRVADRKGRGHLSIAFSSYDQLDDILEKITH